MRGFRNIPLYLLPLLLVFGLGCNNTNDCDPNFPTACDYYDPPLFGPLNILVTIDEENPFVPIEVYVGDIDDGQLYFQDTLTGTGRYDVDVNVRYSATATYKSKGRTIIAVDGDRVKSRTVDNCDFTCYETVSGNINLRLKN